MLAKIHSAQVTGLQPQLVDVEIDISRGLHSFSIVGLPDKAVEEAKDRISAAIKNSNFQSPLKGNRRVVVSLAPADIKKEGPIFDLAIALAYLQANNYLRFDPKHKLFLGELALDGTIRPIKGALMIAQHAKQKGFSEIFIPTLNSPEVSLVPDLTAYPCQNLRELAIHLSPKEFLTTTEAEPTIKTTLVSLLPLSPANFAPIESIPNIDLADITGQETAKRGLEIAAAGGHNLAMFGPPGTGKTLLAKALSGILPPLLFEEVLEVTGIYSAGGYLSPNELVLEPPFRSPHHTASYVSLVGGGNSPRAGEITLAHRGVLFLDELPEFEKRVIEALRQPLEERVIIVSRAKSSVMFPANFILVAAMNPCPCGNQGLPHKECICSPTTLLRYQRKISGPIIDRIDLWVEVGPVAHEKLAQSQPAGETSRQVRRRVLAARARQAKRFEELGARVRTNSDMDLKTLRRFVTLSEAGTALLQNSAKRLNLSARAYHRIIKISRTIADLEGNENIKEDHILEALQYRPKQ